MTQQIDVTPHTYRETKKLVAHFAASYAAARRDALSAKATFRATGRGLIPREHATCAAVDARFWLYTYRARVASMRPVVGSAWSAVALDNVRKANRNR